MVRRTTWLSVSQGNLKSFLSSLCYFFSFFILPLIVWPYSQVSHCVNYTNHKTTYTILFKPLFKWYTWILSTNLISNPFRLKLEIDILYLANFMIIGFSFVIIFLSSNWLFGDLLIFFSRNTWTIILWRFLIRIVWLFTFWTTWNIIVFLIR